MRRKTLITTVSILLTLQACSQGSFQAKEYPFPIPIEEPQIPTMQQQAETQAEERSKKTGDPFGGKTTLTVDLRAIPDSAWCYPLPGAKVISNYGRRDGRSHSGIDLKTKPNDSIHAVFDGIVTMSQPYAAYGNCIVLRHANGLETLYSHNVRNLVSKGDYVRKGQVIALTGRTGRASTEHLHFEVRVNGRHYSPQILFNHTTWKLRQHTLTFSKSGKVTTK